jgi:hypothetical protein
MDPCTRLHNVVIIFRYSHLHYVFIIHICMVLAVINRYS